MIYPEEGFRFRSGRSNDRFIYRGRNGQNHRFTRYQKPYNHAAGGCQLIILESAARKRLLKRVAAEGPYTLALDKTNWKFGGLRINFLVLAVVVNHTVAFPIFLTLLPKIGNSNGTERIHILQSFTDLFGADMIHEITADREFIGKVWIDFLIQNTIPFCIRIKENRLVGWGAQTKSMRCFFRAH